MYPPQPSPRRRPAGISRRWFYLALVLVLLTPMPCVVAVVANISTLTDDTDPKLPSSTGWAGIRVDEGTEYWVYQWEPQAERAGSGEATCDVRNQGEDLVFPLDRDQPTMAVDTTDVAGETYVYVGRFTADRTGLVEVRCNGLGERWFVQRDDGGLIWTGLSFFGGGCCLLLGLVVLVIVAIARTRAQNRAP